jgi:outer membrane lipoprotein-sorting protein
MNSHRHRRTRLCSSWLPIALAAVLCVAGAAPALATAELDEILAALAQHPHGHAQFTETVESALLRRPLRSSGELFFTAPDRLEKRTLAPSAETLIVAGDVVTISRGRHQSSLRLSQYPQLSPLLDGIRATLAGDRRGLERSFQVAASRTADAWTLTLRPLGEEAAPAYERIVIQGSGGSVQSVTMERRNGDRSVLKLTETAGP